MVAVVRWADPRHCRTCVGQGHARRGRHRAASLRPSIRAPGRGAGFQKLPEQSQLFGEAGEERAHESSRACPLLFPPPHRHCRKDLEGEEALWARDRRKTLLAEGHRKKKRKPLQNTSQGTDGTGRPAPRCAESRPARTPTTRGDPPAPRSRVRKWRGKHGSVPGRRGHHVQLPTTPSPLRGPPPPAPGAARGNARHQARVRKQVYFAVPLPATPGSSWSRPIPQAAPTLHNPGFRKETRNGSDSREHSRQENLETATTLP